MQTYYGDFHIHIGQTRTGHTIKIPSARDLTFSEIAREALSAKGLDVVGVVDCASTYVLEDIDWLLAVKELEELPEGGLLYHQDLLVIPGAEFELSGPMGGAAHFLAYFPTVKLLKEFSNLLASAVTNINLSSQRAKGTPEQWFEHVQSLGGLFIPAHIFTPHKGLLGNAVDHFADAFRADQIMQMSAVELGLSADSQMADTIPELHHLTFLSNSDAHSLPKIAREYNALHLDHLSFYEWEQALRRQNGRGLAANYGLDPRLGKFYRTLCRTCDTRIEVDTPVQECPKCHSKQIIRGVLDRVRELGRDCHSPSHRPEYHYQVPLEFVPSVGKKTLGKLINHFGSEMAVLHQAQEEELAQVVGTKVAHAIELARTGQLHIKHGAGGQYGKVLPQA